MRRRQRFQFHRVRIVRPLTQHVPIGDLWLPTDAASMQLNKLV